jgi:hypothetical protein
MQVFGLLERITKAAEKFVEQIQIIGERWAELQEMRGLKAQLAGEGEGEDESDRPPVATECASCGAKGVAFYRDRRVQKWRCAECHRKEQEK